MTQVNRPTPAPLIENEDYYLEGAGHGIHRTIPAATRLLLRKRLSPLSLLTGYDLHISTTANFSLLLFRNCSDVRLCAAVSKPIVLDAPSDPNQLPKVIAR